MEKLIAGLALICIASLAAVPDKEVVSVRFRKQTISVRSSTEGPLYSLTDNLGQILYSDLTREEFQIKAPEIFKLYEDSLAVSGSHSMADQEK